jgi:NitT/TauT family transport system substrate-binding protein
MSEDYGRPKPAFFIVLALVIAALGTYAYFHFDVLAPKTVSTDQQVPKDVMDKVKSQASPDVQLSSKEYKFVPADKLTPLAPNVAAGYKFEGDTVKMAINVWAGWAPLVFANNGFDEGKEWIAADGSKFKVKLVVIDDIVAMRDAYASGAVHTGWCTVDMMPLLVEELSRDSRTNPRIFEQVDWSNGGDGIVVRDSIGNVGQLRGKTVALAQNSPSQYFLLNSLINAGVQPSEVKYSFTADAFQAAAAFNADPNIAACVSWSPDIYKLSKVKGNKMLVDTGSFNRLIADVWFARADFSKDHMPIIEAMTRGFLDAAEDLDTQENKAKVAALMAKGYGIPATDATDMLGDAHLTNYAENREFFMNSSNPTNFERTWETASLIYSSIGKIKTRTSWDTVADFSIIKKLGAEEKYAASKNKYNIAFVPKSVSAINAEAHEILTKTLSVKFYTNESDPYYSFKTGDRIPEGLKVGDLVEPKVDYILDEIGKLTGQYGNCRIVIEGHTDSSAKATLGSVPGGIAAVKELSERRAAGVKSALLRKFPTVNPNQVSVAGRGWDVPADSKDPLNQSKNRRVEVKVYPLEGN